MADNSPKAHGPIPYLMMSNAAEALKLYEKAFGATLASRINYPNDENKVMHACLNFQGAPVFVSDTNPERGCDTPSVSSFYINVENVDKAFATAKAAGLEQMMEPQDMFWGDRMGTLKDKFGITWSLGQKVKDMSLDEIKKASKQQAA